MSTECTIHCKHDCIHHGTHDGIHDHRVQETEMWPFLLANLIVVEDE